MHSLDHCIKSITTSIEHSNYAQSKQLKQVDHHVNRTIHAQSNNHAQSIVDRRSSSTVKTVTASSWTSFAANLCRKSITADHAHSKQSCVSRSSHQVVRHVETIMHSWNTDHYVNRTHLPCTVELSCTVERRSPLIMHSWNNHAQETIALYGHSMQWLLVVDWYNGRRSGLSRRCEGLWSGLSRRVVRCSGRSLWSITCEILFTVHELM